MHAVRQGSSRPVVVDTDDGTWFVKLRGAAQGTATLVAEVLVNALAATLGLPVLPWRLVMIPPGIPSDDRDGELADLLRASVGENLGVAYLPNVRTIGPADVAAFDPDLASQIVWLDWLVQNMDRSPANPNILVDGARFWLIDHGAALVFQHDWAAVTEDAPSRPGPRLPHVLATRATRLPAWDPLLTAMLDHAALASAVARVPDSFLLPLLGPAPAPDALYRRRAAYEAFLWKRLRGPRAFAAPP